MVQCSIISLVYLINFVGVQIFPFLFIFELEVRTCTGYRNKTCVCTFVNEEGILSITLSISLTYLLYQGGFENQLQWERCLKHVKHCLTQIHHLKKSNNNSKFIKSCVDLQTFIPKSSLYLSQLLSTFRLEKFLLSLSSLLLPGSTCSCKF